MCVPGSWCIAMGLRNTKCWPSQCNVMSRKGPLAEPWERITRHDAQNNEIRNSETRRWVIRQLGLGTWRSSGVKATTMGLLTLPHRKHTLVLISENSAGQSRQRTLASTNPAYCMTDWSSSARTSSYHDKKTISRPVKCDYDTST